MTSAQFPITAEYVITGTLRADEALSVGSGQPGPDADLQCIRDGAGRLILPGTALAGVLSSVCPGESWGSSEATSRVWVEDAVETQPTSTEIRDSVRIDRHSGTARPGALFAREIVPAGTMFDLEIRVEEHRSQSVEEFVLTMVAELRAGITIGGAVTRGLGRITLLHTNRKARIRRFDLATRDGMIARLRGDGKPVTLPAPRAQARPDHVRVTIPWRARGPLSVSVAVNGEVDSIPLSTKGSDGVRLVVPGASIKGVWRTRAERILATLTGDGDSGLVHRLFGTPHGTDTGRGAARFSDCLTKDAISQWSALQEKLFPMAAPAGQSADRGEARRAQRVRAVAAVRRSKVMINDHVAINRWTGGAEDARLFATLTPDPSIEWQPMVIDIDLRRLARVGQEDGTTVSAPSAALAGVALLVHLLRDAVAGDLPVGHATTRGYGELEIDAASVIFAVGEAETPLQPLHERTLHDLLTAADLADVRAGLDTAWAAELSLDQRAAS